VGWAGSLGDEEEGLLGLVGVASGLEEEAGLGDQAGGLLELARLHWGLVVLNVGDVCAELP